MKPTVIKIDALYALKIEAIGHHLNLSVLCGGVSVVARPVSPMVADDLAIALVQHATAAKSESGA